MIYSVNFMDLTEKINPHAVVKYLKDTGWIQYKTKKEYIKTFQKFTDKDEFYQVTIPIEKDLADYKQAMFEAIEQIAFLEGQSTEQLMLYLLNPNTDILKIRLQKKDVEAGSILFDDAINLFENAKKLIAATAQDILHPRYIHQGRQEEAVSQFINNCKFGQTEIGSYIISVVCPFAELDESEEYKQLSIFSDEEQCANSLTRKVTNRIMSNVSTIKNNIDNGEFEKLISDDEETMISANFYEALTGMNISDQDTAVEFIAQWSPVVKRNRCDQDKIVLTHDYYEPIARTIEKLRETINTHSKIVGRVKRLESIPDASKRTNGKVTIVYLDENDNKKTVSLQLARDDYNKAIEAHESGSHVEVIGEIEDNGKRTRSMTVESFSIID
ncbi:OB-fold nucleic acid binding domain-containing protein [Blautia obeum]|jgi:hypothetical protein|uniref:Uncharacterized protein n=1 Tax=Blautia obeum TaxID=40520 RepID=A0A414W113_9FIRM|nr:OB-fold nucleic acid binding domain-containing protein [Blautia obeum]RHH18000.1 hypothetical protein DW222_11500 [Blautia obeum]